MCLSTRSAASLRQGFSNGLSAILCHSCTWRYHPSSNILAFCLFVSSPPLSNQSWHLVQPHTLMQSSALRPLPLPWINKLLWQATVVFPSSPKQYGWHLSRHSWPWASLSRSGSRYILFCPFDANLNTHHDDGHDQSHKHAKQEILQGAHVVNLASTRLLNC